MSATHNDAANPTAGWAPFVVLMTALAVVFGCAASLYLARHPLPAAGVAAVYLCFMLSLAVALAPGLRGSRAALQRWFGTHHRMWLLVLTWIAPYLVYASGTGDFRWRALATLAGLGVAMVGVYSLFPVRDEASFQWQDALVAVLLIAIVLSQRLKGIWNVPQNLDFIARLYLIGVAGWCWTLVRVVPRLGYDLMPSRDRRAIASSLGHATQPLPAVAAPLDGRDSELPAIRVLRAAALNFVWFALLALPAGLALNFIAWNPRWRGWPQFGLDYLEIFLFIALLEEMFFRGFLQTLLSKTLRSAYGAQALVACLFGLFHILHAPFPNWRYVAMATVAGWFYGQAFRQGGGLLPAALTHAAVDTVWRAFFTRG